MNRTIVPVVLLVCAAMGASAPLHAQARGPAREVRGSETPMEKPPRVREEATRARMFAEAQAWLGRLVGRFEVDQKEVTVAGVQKFYGTAVCSHIGSGPGLQCSIHLLGTESAPTLGTVPGPGFKHYSRELGTRTPVKKSSPLLFFGINAETLQIQLVLADLELVTTRSGVLAGDAVDFADNWNVCYRIWAHCWTAAEVTAPPAGEIVMKLSVDQYGAGRKHPFTTRSGHTVDKELRLRREGPVDPNGAR